MSPEVGSHELACLRPLSLRVLFLLLEPEASGTHLPTRLCPLFLLSSDRQAPWPGSRPPAGVFGISGLIFLELKPVTTATWVFVCRSARVPGSVVP